MKESSKRIDQIADDGYSDGNEVDLPETSFICPEAYDGLCDETCRAEYSDDQAIKGRIRCS